MPSVRAATSLIVLCLTTGVSAQAPPALVIEAPPELAAARQRLNTYDLRPLSSIVRLVGLDAPGPPITVVLAGDDSAVAKEVTPWTAGFALGDAGLIVLFPSRSPAYPHDTLEDVLRHEVAHVLIARAARGQRVPRWFHEGLAVAVERPWGLRDQSRLATELVFGPRLTIREIDGLFAGSESAQSRGYSLAAAVVRDLMDEHGSAAPAAILRALADGRSFDNAVAQVAGRSIQAIETDFWNRQRTWTLWIPVATSTTVVWLAVMGLAAFAVRRRHQRSAAIRQGWVAEERLECAAVTTTITNKQFLLASRPQGEPTAANFQLIEAPVPALAEGQVLVRHHFLSLDPYMRGRMNDVRSYAPPQPLNEVMIGGTAGEVVQSNHPAFAEGDQVVGMGGWQQYSVVDGHAKGALRKVDTSRIPLSAYLGAVGMPGVTAWYGLMKICQPKPGDTITVSAASGAVGSVVGQLAKAHGVRAVGFAGGPDKCRYVVDDLGFDACIDYKQHADRKALYRALKDATPKGIDGHFENVGGAILDAVLSRMNDFGRIAVCGMISGYNGEPIPLTQPALILTARLRVEGFIVSEHLECWPEALAELGGMMAAGTLKYRESVAHGIEAAPEAFFGLLKGKNFGKQLVKLT